MREQRQRLDRAAGLRGDDEQRALEVDRALDRADRGRVGRVEHVQRARAGSSSPETSGAAPPGRARSRPCRAARRPRSSSVVRLRGEQLERAELPEHPLGDRQPAQAVGDLRRARRAPQRRRRRGRSCRRTSASRGPRELAPRPRPAARRECAASTVKAGIAHATIVVGSRRSCRFPRCDDEPPITTQSAARPQPRAGARARHRGRRARGGAAGRAWATRRPPTRPPSTACATCCSRCRWTASW